MCIRDRRYHKAGRADMSMLEQIVYLGDLTSADSSYKDVEKYREMSFETLDNAMYLSLIHILRHSVTV